MTILEQDRLEEQNNPADNGQFDLRAILMTTLLSNPEAMGYRNDPEILNKIQNMPNSVEEQQAYISSDPRLTNLFLLFLKSQNINVQQPQQPQAQPQAQPQPQPQSQPQSQPQQPEVNEEEKKILDLKTEGNQLYKKKQFEAALEKYNTILSIQPTNIPIRNNISAVYIEQGRYEECITYCNESLEIARESHAGYEDVAKIYMRMGTAQVKLERYDEGIQSYENSRMEAPIKGINDKIREATRLKEAAAKKAYINPEEVPIELGDIINRVLRQKNVVINYSLKVNILKLFMNMMKLFVVIHKMLLSTVTVGLLLVS